MIKLSELREILYTNKIRGYSYNTKKQLIVFLKKGVDAERETQTTRNPKKK